MGVEVQLQPFAHQVTGHAGLLTTMNQVVIVKPIIANELDFYLTMDSALRSYTPHFYGLVDVTHKKVKNDIMVTADLPSHPTTVQTGPLDDHEDKPVHYEGLEQNGLERNEDFSSNHWTQDKEKNAHVSGIGKNPWALRLQRKLEKKLQQENKNIIKPCLLLENVTRRFAVPCILDLKVGTRLYGDDCPVDKIQRHIEKNRLSTTARLGLRLSGLQVFYKSRYICRNKFFGRGLSPEGFQNALRLFLQNESYSRREIIDAILFKIENLIQRIANLTSYRLFGSSLIIMYEGRISAVGEATVSNRDYKVLSRNSHVQKCRPLVDVRMVDFANCNSAKMGNRPVHHQGPDSGFLFGLRNLVEAFNRLKSEEL